MREEYITARVKQCLEFMNRGGLRGSLFIDTPEEDAQAMFEAGVLEGVGQSQMPTVVKAIREWRGENLYLAGLDDT